ncbi:flagellar hook-associated protein FlgL [Metabacillus halosaccharovorans]|uniref:flagellar hook-associated protein FlgL n=1 Tax=Metabacillus halosaccharovorans TaxID=930124 RepID=UPI00203CC06A|nr:flagellar hook-associated protein FlgL [Metabacillus halosaccharovorans]MCM3443756.1 flagellar hook-associated protein FlgL [Metabacillus halosaccharovorans]
MRVTQGMLASDSLRHLSNSYGRLGDLQNQLSTGKKITRPSQDPVVAMKGMFYRSNLREVEQYQRNLSEAYLWMDNSEAGLEQANSALQRVRELVVQGKTGTYSEEDRFAIATEIEQLKQDLMETANTQIAGRYIFNGSNVDNPPVRSVDPVDIDMNTEDYTVEVSAGVSLKTNINPENVFNEGLFTTLNELTESLTGDFSVEKMDQILQDLDNRLDILQAERSEMGARYNRLEMIENRLGKTEIMANKIISDNEDAEMEKVITDLTTQESVHRAALSVGARIIQPTLMDFLR